LQGNVCESTDHKQVSGNQIHCGWNLEARHGYKMMSQTNENTNKRARVLVIVDHDECVGSWFFAYLTCSSIMIRDDPKLRVIVERYPSPNGVVGGLTSAMKSSLYLTEKTN
jgi:hypothetical protein